MTLLPYTTTALLRAGYSPQPLEEAANRCLNAVGRDQKGRLVRGALYSSDETTQRFWDAFCVAAKVLRGGEAKRMAA